MVKVLAPAKINFTLDITGRLENGYHTVDMVMQSVNLCDVVTVEKSQELTLTCNKDYIPCDSSNTAYKAVRLFEELTGTACNVSVNIEKHIPAQAGLAGGSTDGAAVLVALNKLYNKGLSDSQLAEFGGKIGADVPFCIYGGTMLATGIGTQLEKIKPNLDLQKYIILLCKPKINVSTPQAYKISDSRPFSSSVHSTAVINALISGDEAEFYKGLYNDFDSLLSLEPVQHIKEIMLKNGAHTSVMSGSGPTVYGIFTDNGLADKAYEILSKEYTDVYKASCCCGGCTVL